MLKNITKKIKKNFEIFGLVVLIIIVAFSTNYFNAKKNTEIQTYNNFIDNIYFKKTLKHVVANLEPKYKKIKHKIRPGETFDKILESYEIKKDEIIKIKQSIKSKTNLNKLNTRQIIYLSLDKTNPSAILKNVSNNTA